MISIIAIGNEILKGITLNKNAHYLSKRLTDSGFTVHRHEAILDSYDPIKASFKSELEKSAIIIVTGGLGPTLDDLTKQTAADYFKSPLRLDAALKKELEERFPTLKTVDNQATIPEKAKIIPNRVGTAPGFHFEEGDKHLFLLPGVPPEMKEMFEKEILPFLKSRFPVSSYKKNLCLFNLSESQVDPILRTLHRENPHVSYGIYPQAGVLGVVLESSDEKSLEKPYQTIKENFYAHMFESESGKIDEALHALLLEKGKTLSIAESVTGGSLSQRLTQYSGASAYFMGSVVSYSNQAKIEILKVDPELIKNEGAVSEKVAVEMAQGALNLFHTDFSLAITGVAGPNGGSQEKPVGLAYCAIGIKGKETKVWKIKGQANRDLVIERCGNSLFSELYTILKTLL